MQVKFIYSEKATKFCEISTVDLFYVVTVKSTVEISQNFVAFSEYMNFKIKGVVLTALQVKWRSGKHKEILILAPIQQGYINFPSEVISPHCVWVV